MRSVFRTRTVGHRRCRLASLLADAAGAAMVAGFAFVATGYPGFGGGTVEGAVGTAGTGTSPACVARCGAQRRRWPGRRRTGKPPAGEDLELAGGSGCNIATGRICRLDGGRYTGLGRRAWYQSTGSSRLRAGTVYGDSCCMACGCRAVRRGRPVLSLSTSARAVRGHRSDFRGIAG
ncbi:hypothetical protein D9M71_179760 [compost metagenome]